MNEFLYIALYLFGLLQGGVFAYVFWGKDSAFKRGLIDGLTFKFIWGKFQK